MPGGTTRFLRNRGAANVTLGGQAAPSPKVLVSVADLDASQVQELGDNIPKLLELKTKHNTPIRFQVRIEIGDGKTVPSAEIAQKVNAILKNIKDDMKVT